MKTRCGVLFILPPSALTLLLGGCQAVGLKADRDLRQTTDVTTEVEQAVAGGGEATAITLNWVSQGAGPAATLLAITATALMIRNRRAIDRLVLAVEVEHGHAVKRRVRSYGFKEPKFPWIRHRVDGVERVIRSSLRRVAEIK